jgi:hypothetical protein
MGAEVGIVRREHDRYQLIMNRFFMSLVIYLAFLSAHFWIASEAFLVWMSAR